eukprot:scaffold227105_cov16-Tisochrysis_lutea.AAC.1
MSPCVRHTLQTLFASCTTHALKRVPPHLQHASQAWTCMPLCMEWRWWQRRWQPGPANAEVPQHTKYQTSTECVHVHVPVSQAMVAVTSTLAVVAETSTIKADSIAAAAMKAAETAVMEEMQAAAVVKVRASGGSVACMCFGARISHAV